MNKKNSLVSVYAVVSQLAFSIATPLIVCVWGGAWAVNKFNLPDSAKIFFMVLGIILMISSMVNFFWNLIRRFGGETEKDEKKLRYKYMNTSRRDCDYYAESTKKKN